MTNSVFIEGFDLTLADRMKVLSHFQYKDSFHTDDNEFFYHFTCKNIIYVLSKVSLCVITHDKS